MAFLPLKLNAKRGNWQHFMSRKANLAFRPIKESVLTRDENTCRYCGFQSDQFQEIVNIDQNYANNALSNLATACTLCAQCFFLDSVGLDGHSGGVMIFLPEIDQADLNHFCRALFCSMLRDSPYKGKLQAAYLSLQDRSKQVEEILGPNTQEPMVFGQALIDDGLTETQQNHPLLSVLKLLPIRKFYKNQAEYWKSTVFANIPL